MGGGNVGGTAALVPPYGIGSGGREFRMQRKHTKHAIHVGWIKRSGSTVPPTITHPTCRSQCSEVLIAEILVMGVSGGTAALVPPYGIGSGGGECRPPRKHAKRAIHVGWIKRSGSTISPTVISSSMPFSTLGSAHRKNPRGGRVCFGGTAALVPPYGIGPGGGEYCMQRKHTKHTICVGWIKRSGSTVPPTITHPTCRSQCSEVLIAEILVMGVSGGTAALVPPYGIGSGGGECRPPRKHAKRAIHVGWIKRSGSTISPTVIPSGMPFSTLGSAHRRNLRGGRVCLGGTAALVPPYGIGSGGGECRIAIVAG